MLKSLSARDEADIAGQVFPVSDCLRPAPTVSTYGSTGSS